MSVSIDHSRRSFLRLGDVSARKSDPIRPPWTSTRSLTESCTRCGECVTACPEKILVIDAEGWPQVDFNRGGCTLCGYCATACAAPVFDRALSPAWRVAVSISQRCLPKHGVLCESCRDICLEDAIRFERIAGQPPAPVISVAKCTGCGACVSTCPVQAIAAVAERPDGGASRNA